MSIQLYQLVALIAWACLCLAFWKIKNTSVRILLVVLGLAIFMVNPVRHTQEGVSGIERVSSPKFSDIPKRVIVEEVSFEERQEKVHQTLNSQLESIENEIQK